MNNTVYDINWAHARVNHWWEQLCRAYNIGEDNPIRNQVPHVIFSNRMVSTAGTASRSVNRIKLSLHFMEREGEAYDDVIAHELAHSFTKLYHKMDCKHGPLWCRAMLAIGKAPARCHRFESAIRRNNGPQPRQFYNCTCGTRIAITQNRITRMRKGKVYICVKCRTPVNNILIGV